ncbi:S8 family serine peptidase [Ectothiorhodospira variabilis]|uniref:S8 family serine peptidase n=1 Tax=Ectothiorhodospira variabilis TaxID=505694 RepID=UPI001EFA505A|nr:S8 family serine peptidase [Ectothiorhodospira variabilis]MCG5495878.1 S8 family serine peptidase [Ectothiorhodospira variabilis]MCG5498519.1 S8 family serine peptidase [Ectothiorhodospira variabilis]MCG5505279.1 S8 family serine peptidase [Ectothiorhodospira variabilis]MCG5508436.1 S8 family serine peptidase [Ectothiorhodospira variabilis]
MSYVRHRSIHRKTVCITLTLLLTLTLLPGCGGGSGGKNVRTDPNQGGGIADRTQQDDSAPPATQLNQGESLVAVADTGLRHTHQELTGRIIHQYDAVYSHSEHNGSNTATADHDQSRAPPHNPHGTAVAGIIAGNRTGNAPMARLMDIRISNTEDGNTTRSVILHGMGHAATQNADVFNLSYNADLTQIPNREEAIRQTAASDMILVESAGNRSTLLQPLHTSSAIYHQYIIVGALNAAGNDRADFSNHPGGHAATQARYLLAPGEQIRTAHSSGDQAYTRLTGTSAAAPAVSAAAATLRAHWPHLDANTLTQRLLDSADRHFSPLYGDRSCGDSGNVDCGLYHYGQGRLNLEAALAPQGELQIAMGATVDTAESQSQPGQTHLQLPAAFGDARLPPQALSQVAGFDALGRDYLIDLSPGLRTPDDPYRTLHRRVQQAIAATNHTRFQHDNHDHNLHALAEYNGDGMPVTMQLTWHRTHGGITGYQFAAGNPAPGHPAEHMPLLAYSGGTYWLSEDDTLTGLSGHYRLNERLTLSADYGWSGDTTGLSPQGALQRLDTRLSFRVLDHLTWHLGSARVTEQDRLMGSTGGGALHTRGNHVTQFIYSRMEADLTPQLSLFAEFEQGRGDRDHPDSLIHRLEQMTLRQAAAGLVLRQTDTQWVLVYHEPLRVHQARAHLRIPSGRTMDGRILYDHITADLAPDGRQRNLELGLRHPLGAYATLQAHLLHIQEPGHRASAPSDILGAVSYQRRY